MDLKKITRAIKRIGLGLAAMGATTFALSGCSIPGVDALQSLVKGILPTLGG